MLDAEKGQESSPKSRRQCYIEMRSDDVLCIIGLIEDQYGEVERVWSKSRLFLSNSQDP